MANGVSSGFLDTAYGDTPWEDMDTNQQTVYSPDLEETFRFQSIFYGLVTYGVNLAAARTNQMVFTQRLPTEVNIAPLATRQIWLPQFYSDSRSITITCNYYGDKVMLHDYDDLITYWRQNGVAGLRNIVRQEVAPHMTESLDRLARNAFLDKDRCIFAGGASDFGDIQNDDVFDLQVVRDVQLWAGYKPDPAQNPIVCLTAPPVNHTLLSADSGEFVDRMKYADAARLLNWEIGSYGGVRFATHPHLTLWNCGEKIRQTTIYSAIGVGDGAPDPEDPTKRVQGWAVGQAGATHSVRVASTAGFAAGDIVTLHYHREGDGSTYDTALDSKLKTTTSVLFNDPQMIVREINEVVDGSYLNFTEPVTVDWFQTAITTNVYGYVTKGRPVHAALFLKGPRGVVSGVLQPPQMHNPPPIDDTESIYRFAWKARLKYQKMYQDRFLTYFFTGPIPILDVATQL